MRPLVIGTSTGGGDIPPLLALTAEMERRGFDFTLAGDDALHSRLGSRIKSIIIPEAIDPLSTFRRKWEDGEFEDLRVWPESLFQYRWAADMLPWLLDFSRSAHPDVLVCTGFTLPLGMKLRQQLGVPVVWLNSSFFFGPRARRAMSEDFAENPSLFAAGVLPFLNEIDLILTCATTDFDPPPDSQRRSERWVGPLYWEDEDGTDLSYLKTPGDPWCLITLSSYRQEGEFQLAQVAIPALLNMGWRVILTTGDARDRDRYYQLEALEGVQVETFASHSQILQHAKLCISHGGYGIVSRCLRAGVPLVCVPWGRDQPGVAWRVERLGIGLTVPKDALSQSEIERAVKIVNSPSYQENAACLREEHAYDPDSAVIACNEMISIQEELFRRGRVLPLPGDTTA